MHFFFYLTFSDAPGSNVQPIRLHVSPILDQTTRTNVAQQLSRTSGRPSEKIAFLRRDSRVNQTFIVGTTEHTQNPGGYLLFPLDARTSNGHSQFAGRPSRYEVRIRQAGPDAVLPVGDYVRTGGFLSPERSS